MPDRGGEPEADPEPPDNVVGPVQAVQPAPEPGPPTWGLVCQFFGLRYMASLFGFVFLSHQIGSFLGAWLGGKLYDLYGAYDVVWWLGVGLGIAAAIVHLPIREAPAPRLATAAT